MPDNVKNWLLVIEGDVSPYLVGPMDEDALLPLARKHRAEDPSAEDGLYTSPFKVQKYNYGNQTVGLRAWSCFEHQASEDLRVRGVYGPRIMQLGAPAKPHLKSTGPLYPDPGRRRKPHRRGLLRR